MEKIGPLNYGGDMDDPDNPASPFVRREDAEAMAREAMGLPQTDEADAQTRTVPREVALEMYVGALTGRMRSVAAKLRAAREQQFWGDVQEGWQELEELLPPS